MARFFVACMFCGTSRFINGNWASCDPCGVRGYYNPHYGRWRVFLPAHAVPTTATGDELKWSTVKVTFRKYYDLDGNEVDFVTWLQIHAPELAEAYGLTGWRPHVE